MENALAILVVTHVACAVWAGILGEPRACGFLAPTIAYLLNPILGAAVLIISKDKRDLGK